jgi:glucose-6-phosphate dehydrogenase assembly protein OpcA
VTSEAASAGTAETAPNPPATVPLARWAARSVSIGDVCGALTDLRQSEETTATRTSVLNLVVAGDDPEAAARAASAMRRLGQRHPGRTLCLVCRPDRPEGIDATVELHSASTEGMPIWWEEVNLELGGQLGAHLASVVTPLLLAGLPTAVWYPAALPPPDDPLLGLSDVVLVDARWALQAGSGLAALVELSRRHEVIDLSWCRLTPWRRLLASLFEPQALRPYLRGVTSARVAANPGPGRLLAGWLIDRIGVPGSAVTLEAAIHASIQLEATHAGQRATFSVQRPSDDPLVLGAVQVEGGPVRHESAALPEHGLTWSLAQALSRLARDPRYDAAIRAALVLEK